MRIRHYGFLSSAGKTKNLANIRRLIGAEPNPTKPPKRSTAELMKDLTGIDISACPQCKTGHLKKMSCLVKQKVIYRFNYDLLRAQTNTLTLA
jgi:hypothetical protein